MAIFENRVCIKRKEGGVKAEISRKFNKLYVPFIKKSDDEWYKKSDKRHVREERSTKKSSVYSLVPREVSASL